MNIKRNGRQALPIDARIPEILATMRKNQVVIVEAETGAGKSTRIGQAAMEADRWLRIIHTLPRRLAVRSIGKRIADEVGCEVGDLVGWRLRGETPRVSSRTRMVLEIDQTLANWIREHQKLPEGLIIVDEAHERSIPTDLLLGMLKEYLPNSPNTKIVIMSATIDTQKFSAFFGGAPVISVSGRCFPVSTEVVQLGKYEHHSNAAGRAGTMVIDRFLAGRLAVPTEDGLSSRFVAGGTVLVLLPGKEDISEVRHLLQKYAKEKECEEAVVVMECHGESREDEQRAVLTPVVEGTLRFVCATEVVRTSVTVPDVIGVIDSLQIKRMKTNPKGIGRLIKIPVSRAEADQAKGRAGRTQPGFYIACSFEGEYELGRLAPYPTPQILMSPATSVCLQVAAIGRSARTFAFVDPLDQDRVALAIRRLQDIGALDEAEKITEEGEFLLRFSIQPERAKCLITAAKCGVLPETVIACAVLETEGFYFRVKNKGEKLIVDERILRLILSYKGEYGSWQRNPAKKPDEVDLTPEKIPDWATIKGPGVYEINCGASRFAENGTHFVSDVLRRFWAGESRSDFFGIVQAYRMFKQAEREVRELGGRSRKEQDDILYNWCKTYQLNMKRIRMAEETMQMIRDELWSTEFRLENGLGEWREFDAKALTDSLLSGMTDNVAILSGRGNYESRLGSLQIAYSCVTPQNVQVALVDDVRQVPTGRLRTSFIQLAGCAAELTIERIMKVVPHLCQTLNMGDHQYDWENDAVTRTQVLNMRDLQVGTRKVPSPTEDAQRVFAGALADQMI